MDKWKFEFGITGVSEETADLLLEEFIALVTASNGTLSGGFLPEEAPNVQEIS